jgi:hypothetical protein
MLSLPVVLTRYCECEARRCNRTGEEQARERVMILGPQHQILPFLVKKERISHPRGPDGVASRGVV